MKLNINLFQKQLMKKFSNIFDRGKRIAVISMVYNRLEYVRKSFESLREKAGMDFDHYVFDDNSDDITLEYLRTEKYNFKKLILNDQRMGIAKNFQEALSVIPERYDYYIKIDSDIQLLSDNFFINLLEIAKFPNMGCLLPRIEGVSSPWKQFHSRVQFFNGHAIRILNAAPWGGFMLFDKKIIDFRDTCDDNFGVDSRLSQFINEKELEVVFIEDLSAYHIDNMFGQRRKYPHYFKERARWERLDKRAIDFMIVSRMLGNKFVDREVMYGLYEYVDGDFESFKDIMIEFVENPNEFDNVLSEGKKLPEIVEEKRTVNKIKISSPPNFPKSEHIQSGTFILVDEIPEWAKNNPRVVIERVKVKRNVQEIIDKGKQKTFKTEVKNTPFVCDICNKGFDTEIGLKIHKGIVHE